MTQFRSKRNGSRYPLRGRHRSYPKEKWIQDVDAKPGALHEPLEVPKGQEIPKTLEERIVDAPLGSTVKNPTGVGKRRVKVTRKLKARANFALNIRPD